MHRGTDTTCIGTDNTCIETVAHVQGQIVQGQTRTGGTH